MKYGSHFREKYWYEKEKPEFFFSVKSDGLKKQDHFTETRESVLQSSNWKVKHIHINTTLIFITNISLTRINNRNVKISHVKNVYLYTK